MFHFDEVRDAVEYTCGVKRELDEASALIPHEQEQVLTLVELHCGPGCGIAVVKSILKNAGYLELATQISQVHGKRAKAAHLDPEAKNIKSSKQTSRKPPRPDTAMRN